MLFRRALAALEVVATLATLDRSDCPLVLLVHRPNGRYRGLVDHLVVPRRAEAGATPGRRIVLVIAFWRRLLVQDGFDELCPAVGKPVQATRYHVNHAPVL